MIKKPVTFQTIDANSEGQRIDNYLLKTLKGVPRSLVYRILRSGEVRVNKGRVKPSYALSLGDEVRIPPLRISLNVEQIPLSPKQLKRWPLKIIHEDDSLLVVDKPSGLAVHGGSGLSYGLIEALRASRPHQPMMELVHRLDRDTSGCILIAKKRAMLRELHQGMREGTIMKSYLLLVSGEVGWQNKTVRLPLKRVVLKSGERKVFADPDGQAAVTHFQRLKSGHGLSLLRAHLETGRTHQIRVHASASGFPIAGDEKYAPSESIQHFSKRGLKRLFLHAEKLEWRSERTGQAYRFVCPLPDMLQQLADNWLNPDPQ